MKSPHFVIKDNNDGSLTLLNKENLNANPICRIDEKEIFFGKGTTKVPNISKLLVSTTNTGTTFEVLVKANEKWNENVKKKHPIRWKLGLVTKSEPTVVTIGTASSNEEAQKLKSFLENIGIRSETQEKKN